MTINLSLNLPNDIGQEPTTMGRVPWFSSYKHGQVGKNKGWEVQTDYWGWGHLFTFRLDLSWNGRDHAGVSFELCILGFGLNADFSDNRHWDDDNNTWEKYDEESMRARMSRDEQKKVDDLEHAYMLVNEDRKILTKQNAEDFLETPQGQAMIDQRVKAKIAEMRDSKDAKRARGEAYRQANISGSGIQKV